ncbi:hypothetical protein HOS79_gp066 [Lactobacillus phage Nyseid]|uniref:Uncharacterized protein n=1 Tax=Lactobacillus phage Nyseid TaxID=2079432 RepID=A0A2K9VCA8_9CAUD|nr:hypothetical protein HOS79_gp066 [Lactobacillus phage Nyseid]AUV59826.1 hypothetical protein [Lactobacillus phage Nyseid]
MEDECVPIEVLEDERKEAKQDAVLDVIERIHSLIGNGISSHQFKVIADDLTNYYDIHDPIDGYDYNVQ